MNWCDEIKEPKNQQWKSKWDQNVILTFIQVTTGFYVTTDLIQPN